MYHMLFIHSYVEGIVFYGCGFLLVWSYLLGTWSLFFGCWAFYMDSVEAQVGATP